MTALAYAVTLQTITCYKCGIEFAVPDHWKTKRLEDHGTFWCPNGHDQHFVGETEAQRLKKELDREKLRREVLEKTNQTLKNSQAALKGEVTKLKNRVGNGVCPCCNRSFQNLQRHMNTKHPDFKDSTPTLKVVS